MNYWIQHADFKSEEYKNIDLEEALSIFTDHNWKNEQELLNKLNTEGKETCPFGIGFTYNDIGILHICPKQDNTAMCFFHHNDTEKLLGLIPVKRQKTYESMSIPLLKIPNLIEDFYNKKIDNLFKIKSHYL